MQQKSFKHTLISERKSSKKSRNRQKLDNKSKIKK